MSRRKLRQRLAVWDRKRLAAPREVEAAEAITDWVAVVREELRASGEVPILAIALAELVRRYEQAKKRGMNDLAEAVGKYLADCAAAVLKTEDKSRSGSNVGSRSAIPLPRGRKRQLKIR